MVQFLLSLVFSSFNSFELCSIISQLGERDFSLLFLILNQTLNPHSSFSVDWIRGDWILV